MQSISTDGYGCSIFVMREMREQPQVVERAETVTTLYDRLEAESGLKPRVIGVDPGRRNLFFSSENLDGNWEKLFHRKLTREQYLKVTGQNDFREYDLRRRRENPAYAEALLALSSTNSSCCTTNTFLGYVVEDHRHARVLDDELFREERTAWRFDLKRLKRATLDRCASRVVKGLHSYGDDRVLGEERRPVIVCYGAAKMKGGGSGERSVPVNECARSFYRAVRAHGRMSRVVRVDEYNTTAMCRRCHRKNEKLFVSKDGNRLEIADYRICRNHLVGEEQISIAVLDRDRLGSVNIGVAGEALVRGQPRPSYLCRPG